ncbi:uncharacterized protein JCM6883_000980 [Sporobolomyces salmoneus]|uniref:uncharacterized protein n=1 Tax=Sporobolomyces salmoneus TaxID=183962 RepID=UPI0031774FA2
MFSRILGRYRPSVLPFSTSPPPPPFSILHRPNLVSHQLTRISTLPHSRYVHISPRPIYSPPIPLELLRDRISCTSSLLEDLDNARSINQTKVLRAEIETEYKILKREKENLSFDDAAIEAQDWRSELVQMVDKFRYWSDDSLDAAKRRKETVKRLVEGVATCSSSNSPTSVQYFLRQLSGPKTNTLSTLESDFSTLIDLVYVLLDYRDLEARIFGNLLDPNARALPIACRDFQLHIQHLHHNKSHHSHGTIPPADRRLIRLADGKSVEATPEQLRFIHSPQTPGITTLIAHAGTGKTTAFLGLCQELGTSDVFSGFVSTKRHAKELNHKAKTLGKTSTIDSLAYKILYGRYGGRFLVKFEKQIGKNRSVLRKLDWETVGELLKSRGNWTEKYYLNSMAGEMMPLPSRQYLSRVLTVFKIWCTSSAPRVGREHTRFADQKHTVQVPREELVEKAQQLADLVLDMDNSSAPMPFSAMKKKASLDMASEEIVLPLRNLVIVDEAQDFSECELELCLSLSKSRRVVFVGDPLQSIYQFKGTTDRWTRLDGADVYHLTQTLRFGHPIAAAVNETLIARGHSQNLIIGSRQPSKLYRSSNVPQRRGFLKLDPTYAALFNDVLSPEYLELAKSLRIRLLLSDRFDPNSPFRLFLHGAHLLLNVPFPSASSDDSYPSHDVNFSSSLKDFQTWEAFKSEMARWGEDLPSFDNKFHDWATLVEFFGPLSAPDYGRAKLLLDSQDRLREMLVLESEPADVTLSISHQVKGSELGSVLLSPSLSRGPGSYRAGIFHVAATRARDVLELNSTVTKELSAKWGLHRFFVAEPPLSVTEPEFRCRACGIDSAKTFIGYSTPLPYHPAHVASSSSSSSNTSPPLPPSAFPVCVDCPLTSPYPPLREFARYLKGESAPSEMNDTCVSVEEALRDRRKMTKSRTKLLEEEIALTAF